MIPEKIINRTGVGRSLTLVGNGDYLEVWNRDAWERRYFEDLLRDAGGSVAKAAEVAGLHRSTLYEKLARIGLVEKPPARE